MHTTCKACNRVVLVEHVDAVGNCINHAQPVVAVPAKATEEEWKDLGRHPVPTSKAKSK